MSTIARTGIAAAGWRADLVARRRALGLTQQELADLAGVARRSITAVEAGKPTVRLDVLTSVVDALGLRLVVVPPSQAREDPSRG